MTPRFRADQVGSLIRPDFLLQSREKSDNYAEKLSEHQAAITSQAVAYAVRKQLDLGIRPITSGEFERSSFFGGFFENLEGMEINHDCSIPDDFRTNLPTTEFLGKLGVKKFATVVATSKIRHVDSVYLSDWMRFREQLPEQHWPQCKMTMPSITWQHMQMAEGKAYNTQVYQSDSEYFLDLVSAFRAEVQILYDAGLRSLQVDDPNLTFFVSDRFREGLRGDGIDPESLLDLYIWAHNEAIKGLPQDLYVGVHLCRGNMPGTDGFVSGSYDAIAEKVLQRLNYNSFYLEFDDERSGSFECLRHLPKGKNVILGLISTKNKDLEDIDTVTTRIHEAAAVVAKAQGITVEEALDSFGVSPQCGFASVEKNCGVGTEERMWEKLTLVRDAAKRVWNDGGEKS